MIQWYPGHMYKASKEFRQILPQVDLVIEVLDARLPGSSENPLLAKLRRDKPCIKLLNKGDLSDSSRLDEWIASLECQNRVKTLVCSTGDNAIRELPALCRSLVPVRENRSKMIYAMIAGIPNVGKSTLINRLLGQDRLLTGPEAGITRDAIAVDQRWTADVINEHARARRRRHSGNRIAPQHTAGI